MNLWTAVPLLLMAAGKDGAGPWELAATEAGVTVSIREHSAGVHEIKAAGAIDAPPLEVWRVLRDYAHYKEFMPYMQEARVLRTEESGKVLYLYSLISVPFLASRDYVLKMTDESDWRGGQGYLRVVWTISPTGPPPRRGTVRMVLNNGYWHLIPTERGTKTFATYYLYTDPGGSVPKWIVNRANGSMAPDLFRAVRRKLGVEIPSEPDSYP